MGENLPRFVIDVLIQLRNTAITDFAQAPVSSRGYLRITCVKTRLCYAETVETLSSETGKVKNEGGNVTTRKGGTLLFINLYLVVTIFFWR